MSGYVLIVPELLLLAVAAWALFAELLPGKDRGSAWVGVVLAAAAAAVAAALPAGGEMFGGALVFDGAARFTRTGVALIAALWFLWTAGGASGRIREAVALAALSALGAMLMAEAAEMVLLVLALELATMPAYVLIGYRRTSLGGLEGALKYFLLSMLTSLVMLYGMSFLYGVSGSTKLAEMDLAGAGSLGLLAALLAIVGLFAKLSAAPFHYWAPDAYSGAEPWTVAFVSTVPKAAGALALVRLVDAVAPGVPVIATVLIVAGVASMVLGNLAALTQADVRRMMAYSGVAHTGYLLLAVAALTGQGYSAAIFYSMAYALPSLGVMLVAAQEGPDLESFGGLAQRHAASAWMIAGFFGKLYLFSAAIDQGYLPWVVVAVLTSVVSAGYYLRVVHSAFFGEGSTTPEARSNTSAAGVIAVGLCTLAVIALGVGAGPVLAWMGAM